MVPASVVTRSGSLSGVARFVGCCSTDVRSHTRLRHPCLQVGGDDAQTFPRVCLLRLRALDEQPRIDGPNDRTSQGKDKFIVLASDGVWEFISSQEAIDIVNLSLDEGTMKVKKALKANRCLGQLTITHFTRHKNRLGKAFVFVSRQGREVQRGAEPALDKRR